ncbi:MAG: hypothetical protein LUO91_06105 [Methanomicrobiales archaeon]|nr:hypothetical protein [Methanomicrobiales archaeon]
MPRGSLKKGKIEDRDDKYQEDFEEKEDFKKEGWQENRLATDPEGQGGDGTQEDQHDENQNTIDEGCPKPDPESRQGISFGNRTGHWIRSGVKGFTVLSCSTGDISRRNGDIRHSNLLVLHSL